jgi:hypothetical protein
MGPAPINTPGRGVPGVQRRHADERRRRPSVRTHPRRVCDVSMTSFCVSRYSCMMYYSSEIDNGMLNYKLLDYHVLYQLMQ